MKFSAFKKKAFSLSWEVMIVGILSLVVMAVVLSITMGGFGKGKDSIDSLASCDNRGGNCVSSATSCEGTSLKGFGCEEETDGARPYCCITDDKK